VKVGDIITLQPSVTDIIALNGLKKTEVLKFAAVAEKASEPPLGEAILKAAKENGMEAPYPEMFEALPGHGTRFHIMSRKFCLKTES
jgi:Cu+-exporting ATPase